MRQEKYVLNKHTLQYERIEPSLKSRFFSVGIYLTCTLIGAGILFKFSHEIFPTPKEQVLEQQLREMDQHFNSVTSEFDKISTEVEHLQEKDAQIHRMIFGMDPIDQNIWKGGTGGSDKYSFITKFEDSENLMEQTLDRIDQLKHKLNVQKKSMDTLYTKALVREEKLASVPSIKPVQEDKLKRNMRYLSGYGYRIHPVHKVKKFHKGIDFTAPTGTAIQATGNGVVKRVQKKSKGYGTNVVIDHGFGYETLYAHMAKCDVKTGEKVTKGQKIGEVGSTGTSTAPHLHYEVRIDGKPVNPIDYCMDGLTVSEYEELVHKSSQENMSID